MEFRGNCSTAPALVLRKPILPGVLFSAGVFFSQTPVGRERSQRDDAKPGFRHIEPHRTRLQLSFVWGAPGAAFDSALRMYIVTNKPLPNMHRSLVTPGMSISVRIRNMVDYAWLGQSQGKLCWRLVAILTIADP